MRLLFSEEEEAVVRDEIRQAERDTTGEIRIYVENKCDIDPAERCLFLFGKYKLYNTMQHNAVLLYIAVNSRVFYVMGDEGIHRLAGQEIWNQVTHDIRTAFSAGMYLEGIRNAIRHIGVKLKHFFPVSGSESMNELPDDIIYSEDEELFSEED